jgi:beta-alanine degradation protein BauB
MADVATTKLFENDKIVVWEMILEPGEGSTCEVTDKDGKSCGSLTMGPGFTLHFELQGKELVAGDFRIPITHSASNLGKTRFREILIETK